MNRTAVLLLAGLVTTSGAYAQETVPPSPESARSPKRNVQQKTQDDYVALNFSNIDITALVKVMSELTRKNFLLDERVSGKVTIMTPTRISPEEAYQVFQSALEIKGFTAIDDGSVTRIIPSASARQSGLKVYQDGDTSGEGFVTKLLRMNFINPQEVVRTLMPLMSKDGSLMAYSGTNSVIITDSVHNIKKIEKLIEAMDVAAPEGRGKINVYYLKHANAEDIAKAMSALVSRMPVPPPGGAAPGGPASILEGTVTITSDKSTNSLIIVASPVDYETVREVIQKLDIRRRQVYVEAAIVEISLSKQRELGLEFQAANLNKIEGSNQVNVVGGTNYGNIGNATVSGPAALAGMNGLAVGAVKGTFQYGGQTFLNIGALLRALQTDGDVNVLSTPNILTTDNQKAEIVVGENVPFIASQTQSAATGGNPITNIERKDVGITLRLTPQITSDDNVRLEIYQEISQVIATAGLNPNTVGPSTSKRSASTTVVVKDRDTMVLGGLIRDNVTSSTSKVPLLGDIPLLGWFFKFKTTRVEKTNLMIFITPYIIKNESDADTLTRKKGEILDEFRKEFRMEKKDIGSGGAIPKRDQSATGSDDSSTAPQDGGELLKSSPTPTTLPDQESIRSSPTLTAPDAPVPDTPPVEELR